MPRAFGKKVEEGQARDGGRKAGQQGSQQEVSLFLFNSKGRERGKEEERKYLPSTALLSNCPQQLGLGQDKARSQERNPGHPYRWQALKYLNFHLLPPRTCISRKLESEVGV